MMGAHEKNKRGKGKNEHGAGTARAMSVVSARVARKGLSGKALFEEGPGGEAVSHADSSGQSFPGTRNCKSTGPGTFREQQAGHYSWTRVSHREGGRRQSQRANRRTIGQKDVVDIIIIPLHPPKKDT